MSEKSQNNTDKSPNTDAYGSERLTTHNTKSIRAKVGTHPSQKIFVHENDLPLSEGDHFRYLNGLHTQEPTDHGFYPEYGKVTEIKSDGVTKTYFVSLDGSGSNVKSLTVNDDNRTKQEEQRDEKLHIDCPECSWQSRSIKEINGEIAAKVDAELHYIEMHKSRIPDDAPFGNNQCPVCLDTNGLSGTVSCSECGFIPEEVRE